MKPRNSRERLVAELSAKLPAITEKQRQWAITTCFDKVGNYEKGMVWCSQCGSIFDKTSSELGIELVGEETICPHCGTRLALKNSRKRKISESWYFTILTTCKGFQVCRHFIIEKKMCSVIGCNEPNYTIHEAVQNWIAPDGSETIMARPCKCIPHIYDAWDFYKPMSIKSRTNALVSYAPDKYDINAEYVYPTGSILPILRRNGYTRRCKSISPCEMMKLVLTDREAEGLAKNGQFGLLAYKHKKGYREFCMPYAHAIRIANRNKYIIKDASMWYDCKHYEPSVKADNQERVVWYTDSPWCDVENMKKFDPNRCSVLGCKLFNNMKLSDEVLEALDENDYTAMPLPSNGCVNFVEATEDKPTKK